MSTTTLSTPEGYKLNAIGHLVPITQIKEIDLTRDALVAGFIEQAKKINAQLKAFRIRAHDDMQAFSELSAEKYGAKLGGKKGNLSLVSFDGRFKIQRAISDQLVFDERLQAAKALIDACITAWSTGSRNEIRTLINSAFQVDKAGKIDTARVLSLRQLDIKDEQWTKAMEAIGDSLQVAASRSYIRVYERVGNTDDYRQINLDLANA